MRYPGGHDVAAPALGIDEILEVNDILERLGSEGLSSPYHWRHCHRNESRGIKFLQLRLLSDERLEVYDLKAVIVVANHRKCRPWNRSDRSFNSTRDCAK